MRACVYAGMRECVHAGMNAGTYARMHVCMYTCASMQVIPGMLTCLNVRTYALFVYKCACVRE